MKERHGVIRTNYNCHIQATEEQVIVSADVSNIASDAEHLLSMIEQTEENIGEKIEKINADSGYASLANYEELEKRQIDTYMPDRGFIMEKEGKLKDEKNRFCRGNFRYEKENDCYLCPAHKRLSFFRAIEGDRAGVKIRLYKGEECLSCEFKNRCCSNVRVRIIKRDKREEIIERVREKLKTEAGRAIYLKRMFSVEHIFGHIKRNLKFFLFLLIG